MVVLADADLDRAAAAANFGAFFHQGQICMSTERIVADRAVADDLADRLAARASALTVGDPRDPATQIGPLVNAAALERVSGLVDDAVGKGAQAVSGGEADGRLLPAHGAARRDPRHADLLRGVLRPAGHVIEVDGPDEAVAVANDTEYGLSAAVFSADVPPRWSSPSDRERDLPHQRHDRARRAPDALRRGQGQRLGALRRPRGAGGVHRAALDHRAGAAARVSDLRGGRRGRAGSGGAPLGAAPGVAPSRRRGRIQPGVATAEPGVD